MNIQGICINGDSAHFGGSLEQLRQDLTFFQSCEFDGVEVSVDGLDAIIGGRLRQAQVDRIRAITEQYEFIYSVHPTGSLNLAFPPKAPDGQRALELEKELMAACLHFCAAIGSHVLVYHSGLIGLQEVAAGLDDLPGLDELEEARQREVAALRELLPLAADLGVIVGMENRDPHPWEIATLRRAGLGPDDLLTYHGGLSIPNLVRQIEEVDHPNLGITLDLGHLYVAANLLGFDFLEAVRQAAPHLRHIHSHDNMGRLGSVRTTMHDRLSFGDGDLHMPIGWGTIPHAQVLAQLAGYDGLYVLEIMPRFREHYPEALQTARVLIDGIAHGAESCQ